MIFGRDELRLMRNESSISFEKMEDTFRIFEEILNSLDDEGIKELFGGYESDINEIYGVILEEIYNTLYGNKGVLEFNHAHFDKLTETIEETLRIENLNYFITSVLSGFEMNWHHLEWGDVVQRYKKFAMIAARDHGKSYFFSNAYIVWKMYRYSGENYFGRIRKDLALSKRGFLFSFSIQQAIDLLDIAKSTIQDNDILRKKLFPGSGDGWAKTDIVCKNGARLTVRGFGSSVRGAHPGYIVVDDPLKDNAIYSSVQRKKGIDYFHAVIMNMIVPEGQVGVVGTPFHQSDLYGDLKSKKGWHVREYPAIFPNGRLLWSNRWNFAGLLEKRDTQGTMIFSREILCRPVTNESSIFPYEIVARAFTRMEEMTFVKSRENYPMKFNKVVTAVDFSISSSVGADYTVILTAGVDEDDRLWLMNFQRFKGKSFAEQLSVLKSVNANFRPDIMLLEANVFQQIFVQEGERAGLPVMPHHTGTNKYDMKAGLPSLALLFERAMIKIPRGNQESIDIGDSIALELSSVTWTEKGLEGVGEHDDIAMAMWLLSLAGKSISTGFKFRFI